VEEHSLHGASVPYLGHSRNELVRDGILLAIPITIGYPLLEWPLQHSTEMGVLLGKGSVHVAGSLIKLRTENEGGKKIRGRCAELRNSNYNSNYKKGKTQKRKG
jgi:hypothetical protein